MKKAALIAVLATLVCARPAQAVPIFVTPRQDLSFGEALLNDAFLAGSITISAANGAVQTQNVTLIAPASAGLFDLEGNALQPIVLTVVAGPPACDLTYINPCVGTPTLTVSHNSAGYISNTNCTRRFRCIDTVRVGGTMTFSGAFEGRWTSVVTITANYQ